MLKTVTTVHDLRLAIAGWRAHDETIGFVATMGALHAGHLALVKQAQRLSARTVVSIFVNPLQFNNPDDLARYPRPLEADQALLAEAGCDLLFTPSADAMYPADFVTRVMPGPIAEVLEGAHRPGHFTGMATVVAKLLLQVMPDYACFGEKDFQQLRIIEQMVRDLAIAVTIVPVATVREPDGLALSSRNVRLTEQDRRQASFLPEILFDAAERLRTGEAIPLILEDGRIRLREAGFKLDYLELVDGRTLTPLDIVRRPARLLFAGSLGAVRLIDNVEVM